MAAAVNAWKTGSTTAACFKEKGEEMIYPNDWKNWQKTLSADVATLNDHLTILMNLIEQLEQGSNERVTQPMNGDGARLGAAFVQSPKIQETMRLRGGRRRNNKNEL
jgi:hypothetical protein